MSTDGTDRDNITNTVRGGISDSTVIQAGTICLARHAVHWPIRVGAIPEQTAHYQRRKISGQLDEALHGFGTVVLRQVLSGTGGVGKTQLAAHHARTLRDITNPDERLDLLVWANASTRDQITFAYTQAARQLFATVPDDPEHAAQLFLTWLQDPHKHPGRKWLVVWDDLADPAAVQDLWPPHDQPCGRVLVTTRRRDHPLTQQGRHLIDVDVYTPQEAHAFLTHALAEAGVPHAPADLESLARDLGHLPLALGQAVTYMAELRMSCEDYLHVFHDRMETLENLFPSWENPIPLAATWDLSLAEADTFYPNGLARPLMGLIALLGGASIPKEILTSLPIRKYLSAYHTDSTGIATSTTELSTHQIRTALANLVRLNIITRTDPTPEGEDSRQVLVGAHQLVQRATREHHETPSASKSGIFLADAIMEVLLTMEHQAENRWEEEGEWEHNETLIRHLYDNMTTLWGHVNGWQWTGAGHPTLFKLGQALDDINHYGLAAFHWDLLLKFSTNNLPSNHRDILLCRHSLACSLGNAGQPEEATSILEGIFRDRTEEDKDGIPTLATQLDLADWSGEACQANKSSHHLQQLLTNQDRFLGENASPRATRGYLAARQLYKEGKLTSATTLLRELLGDRIVNHQN